MDSHRCALAAPSSTQRTGPFETRCTVDPVRPRIQSWWPEEATDSGSIGRAFDWLERARGPARRRSDDGEGRSAAARRSRRPSLRRIPAERGAELPGLDHRVLARRLCGPHGGALAVQIERVPDFAAAHVEDQGRILVHGAGAEL